MLKYLQINNFLLFKKQEVHFSGDFTVITGETGSGKSMLIKALKFVLGEKTDNLNITDSENIVTAQFSFHKNLEQGLQNILDENNIELEDKSIIIRRSLGAQNKGKIFINDVPVTLGLLKKISNELVEFHSQHKQLEAFNHNNCLNIIDQFANHFTLLEEVKGLYQQITSLELEIKEILREKEELKKDQEHLEYGFKELNALHLKENEELELIEKKKSFSDRVKVVNLIESLLAVFSQEGNVIQKLIKIQRDITKNSIDEELEEYLENSINQLSELENLATQKLRNFDTIDDMESIEIRLSKIKELARKYRCPSDQLINIENDYQIKLDRLNKIEQEIKEKTLNKESLLKEYFIQAEKLSISRSKTAIELEHIIINELKELKLEQIEFKIELTSDDSRPINAKGIDQAKFLIKTNKGFAFAEVNQIASGGELSRIMLAFKVALARINQKTTIIFDEIDTGTGGAVAETIGKRMKKLSSINQIIAISHQPQVASKADQHLYIEKLVSERNETIIKDLNEQEKINEIARMLSGVNITNSAIEAAVSLIKN